MYGHEESNDRLNKYFIYVGLFNTEWHGAVLFLNA